MSDNYLILLELRKTFILMEMVEKTKGCALVWSKLRTGSYQTTWPFDGNLYDAVISKMQSSIVIDFILDGRHIFSLLSSLDPRVQTLYDVVEETFSTDSLKDLIDDLDGLPCCGHTFEFVGIGGVVVGGHVGFRLFEEIATGGVVVGGSNDATTDLCDCNNSDILIVIDTSGSMGGVINALQDLVNELGQGLDSDTCRWGVVEYRDITDGGDFTDGWHIVLPFSGDIFDLSNAVESLSAGGGGDQPEANFFALRGAALAWETTLGGQQIGSINRQIIWIGDAEAHEGGDYPTRAEVISALNGAEIVVSALNTEIEGTGIDTGNQATDIITATGGLLIHDAAFADSETLINQFCSLVNQ
jgi:hypothetical protein